MLIYQIKKNAIVAFLDFVIEKSSAVKFSSKVEMFKSVLCQCRSTEAKLLLTNVSPLTLKALQ